MGQRRSDPRRQPRLSRPPRPQWRLTAPVGILLAALLPGAGAAATDPPGPLPLDRLLTLGAAVDSFKGVAISRDGGRVAWTEAVAGPDGRPGERTAIFIAERRGGEASMQPSAAAADAGTGGASTSPRRITARAATAGTAFEHHPVWSPDGDRLAFLSDATQKSLKRPPAARDVFAGDGEGQLQLWVADLRRGTTAEITHLDGHLGMPRWSPDGEAIAFLFLAGQMAEPGPTRPTQPDAGVVGEAPREQRLAVVELATGTVQMVSPADLYVYEYDWSPDGRSFAATAARGSGDDNWWLAELWVLPRSSGATGVAPSPGAAGSPGDIVHLVQTPRSLLKPPFQIANPSFSPDGRSIAFIGGLMSDQGVTGGDVYVIPATGDAGSGGEGAVAASDLTPGLQASVAWLSWEAPGEILCSAIDDGAAALFTVDPGSGKVAPLWKGAEVLSDGHTPRLAAARDGRTLALVRQGFLTPPEVWAGTPGRWTQLSRRNAALRPAWGEPRSLHWQSDGAAVQGWLLAPPQIEAGRRYPLIVVVHGGPASSHKPGWPTVAGALANQGFFVLLPNPRGSYGQGESFTRGNVKDFGYGDLRDILAGVDAAVAAAPIDGGQVGIYGWSYGGYMVMWAVTQTGRFQAAVAGAGIADWQSYYGQNRIDQWMIPYFGATVYDDPWIYARSSPLTFIKHVKTPTLVLQGERDAEVPAPQAYEFWHALRTLGVETQLVIYPGEGHHLEPASDYDRIRRTVEWFAGHLHAVAATPPR
ncbi:MAG TPA: S9 family peptidase [Thermoanaerobaculia bacterium]|nr:S9 family peptidase [Thermoanaerobaculia bacterium]